MIEENPTGRGQRAPRHRTRTTATATCVAALVAGLILLGAIGPSLGAQAAPPAPTPLPEATAALGWLASQLGAHGGTLPGPDGSTTDWGVTADAVLAFTAAGRASDPAAITATDHLVANERAFTTWTSGEATVRDAGATAKTLLVLRSMGRPGTAGELDLEVELRSMMETSGVQAGRFSDVVPDPSWNAANGFAQSAALLSLAMTGAGMPPQAVTFLLAQQCPAGGFRLTYGTTAGCSSDGAADSDATALSLTALLAAPRDAEVRTALERGTAWLTSRQGSDGAFGGTGPTAAANANSTGLISQYLRAAGSLEAADRGATWITGCCQLSSANATGTPAAVHVGAIGYDATARGAALTGGITPAASDQWRRTTAQAVLALGLAPYGPHDVEPLTPTDPGSTSTTPTSTTPTSTTPTSTSTTSTTTSTTAPAGMSPTDTPSASVEAMNVSSSTGSAATTSSPSSVAATTTSGLARTGTDARALLVTAVGAILLGAILLVARSVTGVRARTGRRVHR